MNTSEPSRFPRHALRASFAHSSGPKKSELPPRMRSSFLPREVKDYLKKTISEYPDEVLNSVTQAAYAVDRSRNRFSESHFASEAGAWLATYVRDLMNAKSASYFTLCRERSMKLMETPMMCSIPRQSAGEANSPGVSPQDSGGGR